MALLLGVLSMLCGSLLMSVKVETLDNSFLMVYGVGLFFLGAMVLSSRKTRRVKKPVTTKIIRIFMLILGPVIVLGGVILGENLLIFFGSLLFLFGAIFFILKIELLEWNVKPLVICKYMIIFGIIIVVSTFIGLQNESLRSFGFIQLVLGVIFAVIESVKEIKPNANQMPSKAK